jgi:putative ABC transport system permease protein
VANLLLAQGIARSREMALRVAIGAGRWHITRQLLVESLVLAGAGALAGIPVAAGALALLVRVVPAGLPRVAGASLNLGALGFAVAAVCLTAVVCGLLPAMLAGRVRPAGALRAGGRGHTGGRGLHRVRGALVVAEVALSLVLLAGAGVLARSYRAIAHHELGFRPDDVLTMYMLLPEAKYAARASRRHS